jgi:DNA helicase INO80
MPFQTTDQGFFSLQTIQSISLLAWLAETQNIWGPFLVVAPTSTVHNWQQELTRFVPKLKAIPYWGKPSDRQVLRRDWNRKSIVYTEDAPFHLVVTSYDMAVQDHSYFQKVRWQYMILDEAQAVKNSSSLRWTTLLSLKTRNRLLLTGTPIQNSMTGKSSGVTWNARNNSLRASVVP